jgi:hypothetical protein
LVKSLEKEVEEITIPIPKEISNLIYTSAKTKEKEEHELLQEEPKQKRILLHFTNLPYQNKDKNSLSI